ncbi:hypothetical protein ECAA86_00618 [Escherichia coli AA86]|nr:hypothetical protein ECAA86_00618 [Escherichia coli AA86]
MHRQFFSLIVCLCFALWFYGLIIFFFVEFLSIQVPCL